MNLSRIPTNVHPKLTGGLFPDTVSKLVALKVSWLPSCLTMYLRAVATERADHSNKRRHDEVKHDGEARWRQFMMTAHFEIHTVHNSGDRFSNKNYMNVKYILKTQEYKKLHFQVLNTQGWIKLVGSVRHWNVPYFNLHPLSMVDFTRLHIKNQFYKNKIKYICAQKNLPLSHARRKQMIQVHRKQ